METTVAKFTAAAARCQDVEALIQPFSRKVIPLLDGGPIEFKEVRPYSHLTSGVFFGFAADEVSPVSVSAVTLPANLARHHGRSAMLRVVRKKDVELDWLTLEIEEDPALARCFRSIDILLCGRHDAPRALDFHLGLIANFKDHSYQVIGQKAVRLETSRSRVLADVDLDAELGAASETVTSLKLALFLPPKELGQLNIYDLRCSGTLADA